jgi:hypothetical protein
MRNKTFARFIEFAEKFDMILFILGLIVAGLLLVGIANGYCASVTDDGKGNKGYILINNGKGQGHQGSWTDITTIPELKGAKGDKGEQGIAGLNGNNGKDGINGLNGKDGQQGTQGFKGDKGDKGDNGKDVDPTIVTNLQNGINTEKNDRQLADNLLQDNINIEQFDRILMSNNLQTNINAIDINSKGRDTILQNNIDTEVNTRSSADDSLQSNINNIDDKHTVWNTKQDTNISNINNVNDRQDKSINNLNSKVDNLDNRVNKLERTQYVLETSFRILDTKRITLRPFFRQNFTRNKVDVVGLKIDVKLGKSYEEKLIEKVNIRLDELGKAIGNAPIIERVVDNKGNVKSISIIGNGLKVNGEF